MHSTIAPLSDAELVAGAVRDLAVRTGFPVAFGGLVEGGAVSITTIHGSRTHSLEGLCVRPERGLGGRAMLEMRPRMTNDYRTSKQITHDYDGFILGEGLGTLLAIPIVVSGRARGVIYAGAWAESTVGGVTTAPAMGVAESLAAELRIRDEVERRVRESMPTGVALNPARREELRESYAELRSIAAAVDDTGLRDRLGRLEARMLSLAGDPVPTTTAPVPVQTVHLSPRETDVLACAALGETNAEIASQLGLREGTVKAYLGTAMSKLGASTRHAAVARARRAGLLP